MTSTDWPHALRRYLAASVVLHLVWEVVQLPLYTLWSAGTVRQQVFAVIHCTVGDAMIAGLSLLAAFAVVGRPGWPISGARQVWLFTLLLGAAYTVYSEWLNVNVRGSWAYSKLMPTMPIIGTGLGPLLQWIAVPTMVQWFTIARAPWIDCPTSAPVRQI